MDSNHIEHLSSLLTDYKSAPSGAFSIDEVIDDNPLVGFHAWTEGKDIKHAALVRRASDQLGYWVLLIEWNSNFGYYVVVYPENRTVPLAEMHNVVTDGSGPLLTWKYKPTKRDGNNELRKELFARHFLSTDVNISLPQSKAEIDGFLEELFALIDCRIKADDLETIAPPESREAFPEGKRVEVLHSRRERNSAVVAEAKRRAKLKHGRLSCECCGFDFEEVYGSLGADYIEAHHTKPLSELTEEGATTAVEDLALVCANCHKMLHRKRPWLAMESLSELLDKDPKD